MTYYLNYFCRNCNATWHDESAEHPRAVGCYNCGTMVEPYQRIETSEPSILD